MKLFLHLRTEMDYTPTSEEIAALGLGPLQTDVVRFCCALVERLRGLSAEQRKRALNEASELSLREPLQFHYKRDLKLPSFDQKRRFTGTEVIAFMALGLYVHVGEDEGAGAPLVEMFPEVRAASLLASAKLKREGEELRAEERRREAAAAPLFASLREDKAA